MSLEEKFEGFERFWQSPEVYILVPVPEDMQNYEKSQFLIMQSNGLNYRYCYIQPPEFNQIVVDKMIEAGVQILPSKPEDDTYDVLYGSRKDEYVLVKIKERKNNSQFFASYLIYHKITKQSLYVRYPQPYEFTHYFDNNALHEKMIEAGVEVWSREEWEDFANKNG